MAKYGVQLRDANGDSLYPRTIIEQIYNMAGSARLDVLLSTMRENLEGDIADTNLAVERLREDLNALLSNATLSGAVLDAIVEIKTLLDSNSSDVVEQLVTTMSALRDEAVRNVAQELTLSQKQQARTNVGAVGVKYTDNRGAHLEQAGTEIMPYTKAEYVEYRGSNVDTVINVLDSRSNETREKVDTFLADADTSEQAIDKLKELQDYIKSDETSASQMLGDIALNKNDIADNAEALEKEATRAKQVEMYLESQKADKSGYYENLSVGVSDNLSGRGEATESEFSFRPSGGENKSIPEDGTARINTIKGNSVVWSQFVKDPLFETENNTNWLYRGYSSYNVSNGTVEIVSNGNGECYIDQFFSFTKDHVYLFMCDVKGGGQQSGVRAYYEGASKVMANYVNKLNEWERIHVFVKTPVEETGGSRIRLYCTYSGNVTSYFRKPRLIDLTKKYGAGNEPTTVEEFEALYGNMPDEYNEGTIIDNHTTAIKSVGVNAWDEEWESGVYKFWDKGQKITDGYEEYIRSKNFINVIRNAEYYFSYNIGTDYNVGYYDKNNEYISLVSVTNGKRFTIPANCVKIAFYAKRTTYNHDICIHLVHTGYLNGKYFPYESQTRQLPTVEGGLKRAGTAYDEIRYNKGKDKWEHVQRVGSVDLGTLSWYATTSCFGSSSIMNAIQPPSSNLNTANILCAKYDRTWQSGVFKGERIGVSIGVDKNIFIRDTAYTDATTFKTAMQGVILYYELATPVVTELDVNISPDYKVWDYGTEEAISEMLSTPVRVNANYGFNAVGQITDNTELIKELLARVAVLEAQISQANSANIEPIVE